MTPAVDQFFDEVRGAWRFRWIGVVSAFVIAVLGWTVIFALPDRYEATARVFVDTRTALKPALQGLTIEQNVDSQINYVRQSLLSGPQLEQIAKDSGVIAPTVTNEKAKDKLLDAFTNRIVMSVANAGFQGDERSTAGTIYIFGYMDSNRARSLRVVENLLNSFVERVLGGKRQGSEQAQEFLEAQIKDYEQRLSAAEYRLAAFKQKNVGLMPTEQGSYTAQLQTEIEAAKRVETQLAIAQSRREALANQLHGDAAISATGGAGLMLGAAGVGNGAGDTLTRIQEAQAKLDELLLKFTDRHPDVIATRATLAELKKRRETELESLRKGDANAIAATGAGNNPVFQNIELEMNKVDVEVVGLRRELAQHQGTIVQLRQALNTAPQVEAEYQQLNRDYDVNKAQYAALLENYQKAKIGEKADSAGSVRFEVVVPPTSPPLPVWPKRSVWIAGVLAIALAAGAAIAYALHALRPVISSVRNINALTRFPVLGVVSVAFPTQQQTMFRRQLLGFSAAGFCLLLIFGVALVLNWSGVRITIDALGALVKS